MTVKEGTMDLKTHHINPAYFLLIVLFTAGLKACGSSSNDSNNPTDEPASNQPPTAVISVTPTSGVVSLLVSIDATQSNDDSGIVGYQWDFGDGTTSQSPTTSHTYSTAGSYTLTLTVTDQEGESDTTTTTIHALASLDNSSVIVPAGVTFFDDFEYTIDRDSASDPTGTNNAFVNTGGWTRAKAVNITGSHNGYIYTIDEIPGYSGSFPGRDSTNVLALEALPGSMGSQTDFFLQYGEVGNPDSVPANVWFQFWIYPNYYDDPADLSDQLSTFDGRFKFIYPCKTFYPCSERNLHWLNTLGFTTGEPFWGNDDNRELFMTTVDPFNTYIDYQLAPPENRFKLGQTDISVNITPNRWTLVKIHYDTSTTSGSYEAWMKPLNGSWVKVAEWIDGVTSDFSWTIPLSDVGGHHVFRMPTTIDDFDSWIYLDDFAMATSEDDLPVYPY
jgi:PKD repeat protein